MNQHGAVVPSSRLDARAVQGCLLFTLLFQSDATHLLAQLPFSAFSHRADVGRRAIAGACILF